MVELSIITASIQVFLLFLWNEETLPQNKVITWLYHRTPSNVLKKALFECMTCQSWWMSCLSGLCLFLSYGTWGSIVIIPLCWVLTIGGYRIISE